jgi:hypothetical protein
MEVAMEELHRTQGDVPFGWVLMLQELVSGWRTHRRATHARRDPAVVAQPSDLHHLAAPH